MASGETVAPQGEDGFGAGAAGGREGIAQERGGEAAALESELPEVAEGEALRADAADRRLDVDAAAREEDPQVGAARAELGLAPLAAVARVVERPLPDADLEGGREVDQIVVVVDAGGADLDVADAERLARPRVAAPGRPVGGAAAPVDRAEVGEEVRDDG